MIRILLLGIVAQLIPGLWFTPKSEAIVRSGMVEGDAFVFSMPVEGLSKGTDVQFGVSLENIGPAAPRHYMVEIYDGGRWVPSGDTVTSEGVTCNFVTIDSAVKHPSTFITIFRLSSPVSDSLKVRCRVCSSLATDGSALSKTAEGNSVGVKPRSYVGARIHPFTGRRPSKSKRLLLVGNSLTFYYGEPYMLQEIAWSQGLRLDITASLKGGRSYGQHAALEGTRNAIARGDFDFAFLQGWSREPALYGSDSTAHADVRTSFCDLCSQVRDFSPACRVFIEDTWAITYGGCAGFGDLDLLDSLLRKGSAGIAAASRSEILSTGRAFQIVRLDGTGLNIFSSDGLHQNLAGSYLKACVCCLTLTGKPFSGDVPDFGIPAEDAAYLRSVAERTLGLK